MILYIDADGCPVIDIAIDAAKSFGIEVYIICDTSHYFNRNGAITITVSKGADSVDFALVNRISKGDLAITQDYGLAAMCLAKQAYVMHQDGWFYNEKNINSLLSTRHFAKKFRLTNSRIKGPSKRTNKNNMDFKENLINFFEKHSTE